MNVKLLLISLLILPFTPGITKAQSTSVYAGTFTNTTLTQGGTITMSMLVALPDSIHGYTNFTQLAGQSPLCGAGSYKGRIINDSLFLSFSSNDTDAGCGFDYNWLFSLKGRFYTSTTHDSIAGTYQINNPNNETGFFNVKRPSTATAVSILTKKQPLIYPNPASGKLTVQLPQYMSEATAVITDQLGCKVLVKQLATTTEVDLNVPDGIYFMTIVADGLRSAQKLIIQH